MSKETGVLAAGLLVFLTPFIGVPGSWRTIILVILGAVIAIIGFLLRGESVGRAPISKKSSRTHSQQTFIESTVVTSLPQSTDSEEKPLN
jgi:hypothetical protein